MVRRPEGKDIFEALDALMRRDTGRGAELTKLFIVLSTEALSKDHPAHEWFAKRNEKILDSLKDQLAGLKAQGRIGQNTDCDLEAISILSMMVGLQLWWIRDPESVDANAAFATFLDNTKARLLI